MKILIPEFIEDALIETEVFGSHTDIILGRAKNCRDISDDIWMNCDGILAWDSLEYNSELISKLKKCKVIVRVGVGFDNVDLVAAKNNNIVVCNVPDYGTHEVADHAISFMLSLSRGLPEYNRRLKKENGYGPIIWQ